MPKKTKYPRLRALVRRGRSGQVYTYYAYDMRPEGKKDIQLGSDHAKAVAAWRKLQDGERLTAGRLQEAFERWEREALPAYENQDTRNSYRKQLHRIMPVFERMAWEEVTLPLLREYLDRRSAKTQGNRELSLLSIVWGKARIWGMTRLPWPAAGVKDWKNPEHGRLIEIDTSMFDAVYAQADRVLKDCMDLATATAMRITDARKLTLPRDGYLYLRANKTAKAAGFEVAASPVLQDVVERRKRIKSTSMMMLVDDKGRSITYSMLRGRWVKARAQAAKGTKDPELAERIRGMFLRDMRKRAADLAPTLDDASRLLQHSSKRITAEHYRTRGDRLKSVR